MVSNAMGFQVTCTDCQNKYNIIATEKDFEEWQNGKLIQEAMPYLTPEQRELLISGICGDCFYKMLPIKNS